jgi:hypothetical protein
MQESKYIKVTPIRSKYSFYHHQHLHINTTIQFFQLFQHLSIFTLPHQQTNKSAKMVAFNTIVAVSVLAMAGQSMAAGPLISAGASIIGGLINKREAQAAVAAAGPQGGANGTAPLDAATLKIVEPLFKDCFAALKADPGELHLNKLTKGAQMTGLPSQCMTGANKLLALPNIKDIEKSQGTITVVNSNTLGFSGVDGLVDRLLKEDGATPLKSTAGAKGAKGAKGSAPATPAASAPAAPKPASA